LSASLRIYGICAAWVAIVSLHAVPAAAQPAVDADKAARVKAAYLRYIAEFTTWPRNVFKRKDAPIVLGVTGDDPDGVAAIIERAVRAKGLQAQKRPFVVRRLPDMAEAGFEASLGACHLLFLSQSERGAEEWKRLRTLLRERPIITVGELPGFAQAAGMIEFVIDRNDSRVTMHIDLSAVQRSGLKLSSHLLGLKQGVTIVKSAPDVGACASPACRGFSPDSITRRLRAGLRDRTRSRAR
jgi:hypothetical protein